MTDQDKQMEQVTQAASQLGKPHSNETVPHKISNHDMLVQASIWAGKDVGWLNLNGGLQNEVSHLIGGKCKNAIRRDIRYHIK